MGVFRAQIQLFLLFRSLIYVQKFYGGEKSENTCVFFGIFGGGANS